MWDLGLTVGRVVLPSPKWRGCGGGGRSGGQTQSLGHVHFKMTVRHLLRCLVGSQRWVMKLRGEVWWAGQDRLRPPREKA